MSELNEQGQEIVTEGATVVGECSPKKQPSFLQMSSEVSLDDNFFDDDKENLVRLKTSSKRSSAFQWEDAAILETFNQEQLRFILSLQDTHNWAPRIEQELKDRIAKPRKKKKRSRRNSKSSEGKSDSSTSRPPRSKSNDSGWKPYKKKSKAGKLAQGEKGTMYKPGPRDIGRVKDWKPAKYDAKPEQYDRAKSTDSSEDTAGGSASYSKFKVYKAGPRDIGRNKEWKPANYGIDLKKMQEEDFLRERTSSKPNPRETKDAEVEEVPMGSKFKVYKKGPRDIGRNKGWKPAKYDIDLKKMQEEDFLAERTSKARKRSTSRDSRDFEVEEVPMGHQFKVYKQGPRDIGRNQGWKAADYGIDLKKIQEEDFLRERTTKKPNPRKTKDAEVEETPMGSKFKVYKAGPRDIGRMKGWKPANYGIDLKKLQEEDFLKPKTTKKSNPRKTKDLEAQENIGSKFKVHKAGPRTIGRMKGWKAADYGIDLKKMQQEDFLKPRAANSRNKRSPKNSKNEEELTVKKAGPREIGRMKDWKPAQYEIAENDGDFLAPRLPSSKIDEDKISKSGKNEMSTSLEKPHARNED